MNTRHLRFRSNRVSDITARYHTELDPLYGQAEVSTFVELLCDAYLGWNRTHLMLHRHDTINQSDLLRFHWALEDLLHWRPIQHIVGHTDFCGYRIEVDSHVLIPRPETEEMTTIIQQHLATMRQGDKPLRILDLCTGSGCIAIALKLACRDAEVWAVELSPSALQVAQRNADALGANVHFCCADVLQPLPPPLPPQFDLIVSNPPYVCDTERKLMRRNVLDYEPQMALFVPDADPLLFYRAIAQVAQSRLCPEGLLSVEINEHLSDATCSLLHERGFTTRLHSDFRDRPRWVEAKKARAGANPS